MSTTAYTNVRLLDPATGLDETGTLITEGERIAALGAAVAQEPLGEHVRIVDGSGLCLAPGLVDMRVTIGEPGYEHKETLGTASQAAAAGGVTAMVVLPATDPVIDDVAGLEYIARRAREEKLVKTFAHAAATRELMGQELTEMRLLHASGALAFTDAHKPIADPLVLRRALSYARSFDGLIIQHAEEPRLADGGSMHEGITATRLGLSGIPAEAEIIAVERDLRLLRLTGGRLHFGHLSTGEAVRLIRQAKAEGLRVTADTAPPYLTFTDLDVGEYRTFTKLSPPLRAEADRQALLTGLADGTIDILASDHQPQDAESKRLPFAQAAFGAVGLETMLSVVLGLVESGRLSMLAALALVTWRPADLLGLDLGRLRVGGPADLILFDPARPWRVDRDQLRSKSKNSPWDRMGLTGRCVRTIVDGRTVFTLDAGSDA